MEGLQSFSSCVEFMRFGPELKDLSTQWWGLRNWEQNMINDTIEKYIEYDKNRKNGHAEGRWTGKGLFLKAILEQLYEMMTNPK